MRRRFLSVDDVGDGTRRRSRSYARWSMMSATVSFLMIVAPLGLGSCTRPREVPGAVASVPLGGLS